MIVSRMTSEGKATLPSEVCDALGLSPGDRVAYEIDGDQVVISKGAVPRDGFAAMPEAELQAMIDAALANQHLSIPIDEAFAKVRSRIEARAARMNAA